MPYAVKKVGEDDWVCYNPDTGKIYGHHKSKKEADDQRKALYANASPEDESLKKE